MDRNQWAAALALSVPWTVAYPVVAREARAYLTANPPSSSLSTTDLVDRLHPWPGGARSRVYKALQALAVRELADCCFRGPERTLMGRAGRPWLWHEPGDTNLEAVIQPAPHASLEAELLAYVAEAGLEAAREVVQRVLYGK